MKENNNTPEQGGARPDPETLHKTDPQDNMKGPVSSLMNGISDEAQEPENNERGDGGSGGQKMDGDPNLQK